MTNPPKKDLADEVISLPGAAKHAAIAILFVIGGALAHYLVFKLKVPQGSPIEITLRVLEWLPVIGVLTIFLRMFTALFYEIEQIPIPRVGRIASLRAARWWQQRWRESESFRLGFTATSLSLLLITIGIVLFLLVHDLIAVAYGCFLIALIPVATLVFHTIRSISEAGDSSGGAGCALLFLLPIALVATIFLLTLSTLFGWRLSHIP